MEIRDIIPCKNDYILPIQSKMIANLLLTGSSYQIYQYKQVSNDIYDKYNTYIRYHMRFDKNIKVRDNVAPKDVGYYAGEISWLCVKLGLPLISVKINSENGLPNEGFFVFPQCEQMRKQGITDREIVQRIKKQVVNALEDGSYQKLIDYVNNVSTNENIVEEKTDSKSNCNFDQKINTTIQQNNRINYDEAKFYEGQAIERTILQRERNQEIVKLAKARDKYTCKVCGFSYSQKIVEAHHIVPISSKNEEYIVKLEDLITLCPTCHALAHILLNENDIYTDKITLLAELKKIRHSQ